MAEIGPNIAAKLKPLLLLLSSDQGGEVVAAANAIGRTLKNAGCDFHDLAARLTAPSSAKTRSREQPREETQHDANDWYAMRNFCLAHENQLRPREREFVMNLITWRGKLTPKQLKWLRAIYERVGN